MNGTSPALVLLVDDDEMLRVLTRAALEAGGFAVAEADDGAHLVASVVKQVLVAFEGRDG